MPLRKNAPFLTIASAVVALGAAAAPASAATIAATVAGAVTTPAVTPTAEMNVDCKEPLSFKPFTRWGDDADYAFAPGGSFETGAPGWSLTNASIVGTNESLGIFAGNKSLFIKDRGRVVSPWFCITPDHPTFRYVTYGGEVEMEIDYQVIGERDIDDKLVGETNGGRTWGPSSIHPLATKIPAATLAKGIVARVVFEAEDDVYVDNLLIDPYRRG